MLTLVDEGKHCNRRGFLTIGTLGLGGLSLPDLLRAAEQRSSLLTGKAVVFLFQQGGPSQFETFDPKPEAPTGVRTQTGVIRTTVPGVYFGEHFPRLAAQAHRLTVVRSFQTNNGDHNIVPVVSADTVQATLGAYYSRVAGAMHPSTGLPTNAVLFPQSACPDVTRGTARGDILATGGLGRAYAPFVPGSGGQQQRNMILSIPRDRLEDRRLLLSRFEQLGRAVYTPESDSGSDRLQDQAFRLLAGQKVAAALDLNQEPAAVLARYDTSRFAAADGWSKAARGRRGYYTGHARALGKLMLMARRLCEAGCGFVTVHPCYEGIWDLHADGENLNSVEGMEAVGRAFDHAVAAFIEDLEARGLSDQILLVCCGEMGRTPRINRNGGRDHWGRLAPLLLHGGGLRGGRIIGQSTRDGGEPVGDPLSPRHLISSLMHTLFDVSQMRLQPTLASIAKLGEGPTITGP
ncbi:MAG: DUF1501 domain-containing protein [Gemmataceae bacterium]